MLGGELICQANALVALEARSKFLSPGLHGVPAEGGAGATRGCLGEAVGALRVGSTRCAPGRRRRARRGAGRGISEPPFTVLEEKEPLQAGGRDHQPWPGLRASRDSAIAAGWLCLRVGAAWGCQGWCQGKDEQSPFVMSLLRAGTFSAL